MPQTTDSSAYLDPETSSTNQMFEDHVVRITRSGNMLPLQLDMEMRIRTWLNALASKLPLLDQPGTNGKVCIAGHGMCSVKVTYESTQSCI